MATAFRKAFVCRKRPRRGVYSERLFTGSGVSTGVSERFFPLIVGIVSLGLLAWWVRGPEIVEAQKPREPGADRVGVETTVAAVDLKGTFAQGPGRAPTDLTGAWCRFRGPQFDNVVTATVALARTFPPSGPPVLWSLPVGDGYASPAVLQGRVFLLDYDEQGQADVLRCLSLADGQEIWRRAYTVKVKRNHGMSRTMPAVNEQYVVTIGPKCHVLCADTQTGAFRWGIDLVRDYKTKEPPWYAGQCPILDGDKVILAPAGDKVLLMAVDLATGRPVWKTPNTFGWNMTHASVLPWTFHGTKMYVYCASGGIVAVAAQTGEVLWHSDEWKVNIAWVPSPVPAGPDRILFTGGYNAGALMLRFRDENGKLAHETVFRKKARDCGSDQQTPIFYEGHLYLVVPDGQLICMTPEGERKWASGMSHRFGLGPYLIADGRIFAMNDHGVLTLAQASPDAFKPLGSWKILDGEETWGPLVLVDGRLIARSRNALVCVDARAK